MQYAIEMYFNREMEEKLYALAKKVTDEGLSTKFMEWKTRPHLTLACFNDVDEETCIMKLKEFSQNHVQLPAYIASVGMFTDTKTIFASPLMTEEMYKFQRELHECLQDFDSKGWEWYLPNRWTPHCALALTKEDPRDIFYKSCDLILHEFEKMSGKFVSIGLVKVTFPVEEIFTVDLKRE